MKLFNPDTQIWYWFTESAELHDDARMGPLAVLDRNPFASLKVVPGLAKCAK